MSKLDKFRKAFGDDALRMASDIESPTLIPTGILSLDMAIGGWPRNRVVELYGPESSGKSTLALMAMAEAQRLGLGCIYVDLERTYDPKYASTLGVDSTMVFAPKYASGEAAIDATEAMITEWAVFAEEMKLPGELGIVVIDSIAALLPQVEKDSDIGDQHMGLVGRMMSKMSRKFTPILDDNKVCMMYINQLRATINSAPFAPKTTTTGGNAIKFYSTMRVDVRRIGRIKDGDDIIGANVRIMMNKDKLTGKEGSNVEIPMYHGYGFSAVDDLIKLAVDRGLTTKGGAWYTYGTERFQGKQAFKAWIMEDTKRKQELRDAILGCVVEEATEGTED